MKKTLIRALLSVAMIASVNTLAQAEAVSSEQQVVITMPQLDSQAHPIPAELTDIFQVNSGVTPQAAPPLTKIWVYAVGSSNCDWEYTYDLLVTKCDHGGALLRTAVLEIGYGLTPLAWMFGSLLPSSAMYSEQLVCIANGFYSWGPICYGKVAVGRLREYNLDGYQSGTFSYRNSSANAQNTLSVMIFIK